jgi:hypothetical protein
MNKIPTYCTTHADTRIPQEMMIFRGIVELLIDLTYYIVYYPCSMLRNQNQKHKRMEQYDDDGEIWVVID